MYKLCNFYRSTRQPQKNYIQLIFGEVSLAHYIQCYNSLFLSQRIKNKKQKLMNLRAKYTKFWLITLITKRGWETEMRCEGGSIYYIAKEANIKVLFMVVVSGGCATLFSWVGGSTKEFLHDRRCRWCEFGEQNNTMIICGKCQSEFVSGVCTRFVLYFVADVECVHLCSYQIRGWIWCHALRTGVKEQVPFILTHGKNGRIRAWNWRLLERASCIVGEWSTIRAYFISLCVRMKRETKLPSRSVWMNVWFYLHFCTFFRWWHCIPLNLECKLPLLPRLTSIEPKTTLLLDCLLYILCTHFQFNFREPILL